MRLPSRPGPALLLLGAALAGCQGNSGTPDTAPPDDPNLTYVKLEVPGMT